MIEFADGSSQTVASDTSWKWSIGPIAFNCVYGGETIDARRDKPGWNMPGYDDSGWKAVVSTEMPAGKLVAQRQPPIRVADHFKLVKLTEPKPGVYVFDLGTNLSGWARLTTSGSPGQKITLQFDESLNPAGTVNTKKFNSSGRFQTGEFILSGKAEEVYEPRFTYHGFRYVQVTGLAQMPTLESLVGCLVHTDLEPAAFSCSNPLLNRVQKMVLQTYLNNLHGIPTDCPHREKWVGCRMVVLAWSRPFTIFIRPPFTPNGFTTYRTPKNPTGICPALRRSAIGAKAVRMANRTSGLIRPRGSPCPTRRRPHRRRDARRRRAVQAGDGKQHHAIS